MVWRRENFFCHNSKKVAFCAYYAGVRAKND